MPQLDFLTYPFISQLFWLSASFIALYYYSRNFIIPRISKVITARSDTINSAINEAEKLKQEALNAQNNSEELLLEAKSQASQLINDMLQKLRKEEAVALQKSQISLDKEISNLSNELESYKEKSHNDFSDTVVEIVKYILEASYNIKKSKEEILTYVGTKK